LAVAVLYAFLGIILYVIWRDLRATGDAVPGSSTAPITEPISRPAGYLRVVEGYDTGVQTGDVFSLQDHATLGRAPDNHVVLSDAYVSSYHARLDRRNGEWWLTDLGSRNGTRLNEVPITKPAPLASGDVIGIGQVELKLEIEDQNKEAN
jgi:hypothetical protein